MSKVLLAKDLLDIFRGKSSFLDRTDIQVFTATTGEEVLKIHKREKVDLIVTRLDMPGLRSEDLFTLIRQDKELQSVSTIIVCEDTLAHRDRCKHCKVNAVFTSPVDPALLHIHVQQFLNIALRKCYRAALALAISGKFKNQPLPFWTENISANGMLIKTEEPLAKGEGVFFSFFLPDGTHVSGYGEIKRIVRQKTVPVTFLYGVKFTNIDEDVKSSIDKVVNKQAPKQ